MIEKSILVVEDEPDDLKLIEHVLGQGDWNQRIISCRNVTEALESLDKLGEAMDVDLMPALILLDLSMPGMGGIELLKEIRNRSQFKLVPVVIFTSSRNMDDIVGCYEAGANSFINKPFDYGQFKVVLNALIQYWIVLNKPTRIN